MTSQAAIGRRPNQSGIAAVARSRHAAAASKISSRVEKYSAGSVRSWARASAQARGPDGAAGELGELDVDPRDLVQADLVDLGGVEVERGVDADQPPVALGALGDVAHARVLRRAGTRQDLGDERVVEPDERGPDLVVDGLRQVGREAFALRRGPAREVRHVGQRREQRPVRGLAVEQVLEDGDGALAGRQARDAALVEAPRAGCRGGDPCRRPSRATGRPSRRPSSTVSSRW